MAIWVILPVALGLALIPATVWAIARCPARTPRRVGIVNTAVFSIVPLIVAPLMVQASNAARAAAYYAAVAAAEKNAIGPYDPAALLIDDFDYVVSAIAAPAIGAVAAGWYVGIHNKRWFRSFHGQRCQACGYDLTGNPSGRCSECGELVEEMQ